MSRPEFQHLHQDQDPWGKMSGAALEGQYESYFRDPIGTNEIAKLDGVPPVEEEPYNRWLAGLSEERLDQLRSERNAYWASTDNIKKVHNKLVESIPELYEAQLPSELEAKLREQLGNVRYAVGFNQTLAGSIREATEYLTEEQGISMEGYHNPGHRFYIYDKESTNLGQDNSDIASAIDAGFTGRSTIGRFIAVFPQVHPSPEDMLSQNDGRYLPVSHAVEIYPHQVLPNDAFVPVVQADGSNKISYNAKYVAGFIDGGGTVWKNANFCLNGVPAFEPYAPPRFEEDLV